MKFSFLSIAIAMLMLLVSSCEQDLTLATSPAKVAQPIAESPQDAYERPNPYDVRVMRQAAMKVGFPAPDDLAITHRYLKFSPTNWAERSELIRDETLNFYGHPLDDEAPRPEMAAGPTDQSAPLYVSWPADRNVSAKAPHVVLAELHIPEELDGHTPEDDRLLSAAFELVGLTLDDEARADGFTEKRSSWRPSGRIRVFDASLNRLVPVHGVKVKARRWFTTHEGITNSQGFYSCNGTFKRDANYSFNWERADWSIRRMPFGTGTGNQATVGGPKQRGPWNLDIRDRSDDQFFAIIFAACHLYYYENIGALERPPMNSFFRPQMKITAHLAADPDGSSLGSHNNNRRLFGIDSPILLYRDSSPLPGNGPFGTRLSCETMFNVALHELGHAAHWKIRVGTWSNGTTDRLQESWALAIAEHLTRRRYPSFTEPRRHWAFTMMESSGRSKYTPIMFDLMDNVNQGLISTSFPFDEVSGYSIFQIQAELSNSDDLRELGNRLINNLANPTEAEVLPLITQYENFSQ